MMTVSNSTQQNDTVSGSAGKGRNRIIYFLAGGGIGAGLALLFAPKSGAELRTDISDLTKKGYDETLEFAHHLTERSADAFHSLKEGTDKVYDLAAARLSRTLEVAERTLAIPGEMINGEVKDEPTNKKAIPGRRSSTIL